MPDTSDEQVKSVVRDHWDGRASAFDEQPNHGIHSDAQRDAWLAVLRPLAALHKEVLDIGSGTGFLSLLLAGLGCRVTGIDLAPSMVEQATAKARELGITARFALGDAEHLVDVDGSYDLVIERHVLWTLPHPEQALSEWARVLRSGGSAALIEGDWGSPTHPDYASIHDELPLIGGMPATRPVALLQQAGFMDVTVQSLNDDTLWGEPVTRDRFLIGGRKP